MNDRVKAYKRRRYFRILSRMDAESDEGRWITTEKNHKVHLNEEGVPDKGNPFVLAVMNGKKARVGRSEAERKLSSMLKKGATRDDVKKEIEGLPDGSRLLIRREGRDYGVSEVEMITKDPARGFLMNGRLSFDSSSIARMLMEAPDYEFDIVSPDEFESHVREGKNLESLIDLRESSRSSSGKVGSSFVSKLYDALKTAPYGSTIRFMKGDGGEYGKFVKSINAYGREMWEDSDGWKTMKSHEIAALVFKSGFADESGSGGEDCLEYSEPDVTAYSPKPVKSILGGHKRFYDKAMDTHSYEGDGDDQVEFFSFNSNVDDLLDNITWGQEEAFQAYTKGWLMDATAHSGWKNMSGKMRKWVRSMEEVVDKSVIDEGVVVTRLSNASLLLGYENKNPLYSELKAMVGKKVVSRGFMSCAAADEGLSIGDDSKRVEYKIAIPSGTTGAGMWLGDYRINGWGPKQREFCMNRDTQYEVANVTLDPNRNVYTVELKYLGRLDHDYGDKEDD